MAMNQENAPLLQALEDYRRKDRYGFTPPGHRQGRGIDDYTKDVLGEETFAADMLVSGGLDDRHSSQGYLADAEALMAEAVGADAVFFSTCGSSLSVKAAMLAVGGGHNGLLIPRDVHKSVVAGLIFTGVEPRWIEPRWDEELNLTHPPSPESVAEAWERHPDASGALIVSPTPYGTCADIAGIAKVCHDRGKPLIIDEAWGAHLPFHPDLPTWAMNAGADVCVTSVHKMGGGYEQGSMIHSQGDLVDARHLAACADLLMTTSPNLMLYAAMDGWRRHMVADGQALLSRSLDLARSVRTRVEELHGLHVLEDELLAKEASHDLDRMQVLIDVSELGISGYQAADWLREEHRIDVGLSDHRRILATLSFADTAETAQRLLTALGALSDAAETFEEPSVVRIPSPRGLDLEMVMLPRDAFFAAVEHVPAEEAAGRIAAEQITPYPPGIPAVVPGERLNKDVIEYLRSGLDAGMVLPDPADQSLETFRVVRE
jgi:arginine decarboxylase